MNGWTGNAEADASPPARSSFDTDAWLLARPPAVMEWAMVAESAAELVLPELVMVPRAVPIEETKAVVSVEPVPGVPVFVESVLVVTVIGELMETQAVEVAIVKAGSDLNDDGPAVSPPGGRFGSGQRDGGEDRGGEEYSSQLHDALASPAAWAGSIWSGHS